MRSLERFDVCSNPPTQQQLFLMKPVQPDDTLAKIVGSKPLPRSEVTNKLWDYLTLQIYRIIRERKMTQTEAAKIRPASR
jgi:chromatin remodeling complex protein RSC6